MPRWVVVKVMYSIDIKKAEVQRKLRMDKQQQLEGMCMELEAANSKGNSRQLFQIVKSMTRKFTSASSATGENLTEAA